jgi:hypothetical protein
MRACSAAVPPDAQDARVLLSSHAPSSYCPVFNEFKNDIFHEDANEDNGDKPREDLRDIQLVFVFVNEPAYAAGAGADAEDEFRRDERAP